jgi:hypothetical protein
MHPKPNTPDWRHHGVKVIPGTQLDPNTPQTPGMHRAAAITYARTGAQKLWAGTVTIHPTKVAYLPGTSIAQGNWPLRVVLKAQCSPRTRWPQP